MFASIFLVIFLILIISTVFVLSKKTKIVYEVLLVTTGIVLVLALLWTDSNLAGKLQLDPEMLLYGFLPLLLLEIAYTMPYKEIIRNIKPISLLAIASPVISAISIGAFLKIGAGWIGYDIPFLATLLFGAILSSTDPVTVLALFRKLGAPKKLTLLFEGESLFNDGASLAFFFLVLAWLTGEKAHTTFFEIFMESFGSGIILQSVLTFSSMIFAGILFWTFSGIAFSKVLHRIRSHQYLAILVIIISAYATFSLTDLINTSLLPASAVIATIFSSFIIGNYGRFKIDIRTEELAQSFFAFLAFLINSIVFLFIGTSIAQIPLELFEKFLPVIPVVVVVIIISRALSVYLPIGILNATSEDRVPPSWLHVLAWWSLRWGLALALVGFIPEKYQILISGEPVSVHEFLALLVIFAVLSSIFLKTLTLERLIKKLGINKLSLTEKIEEEETKLIVITSMMRNIERMHEQKYLSDHEKEYLINVYGKRREIIFERCESLVRKAPNSHSAFLKVVSLHALALERHFAKELFEHGDMTEKPLKRFLAIIDRQMDRVRNGKTQIREIFQESYRDDIFEKIEHFASGWVNPDPNPLFTEYLILRSRVMILEQMFHDLRDLYPLAERLGKSEEYDRVEKLYLDFYKKALEKRNAFYREHEDMLPSWQERVLQKTLKKLEETIVSDISKKELVSERFSNILKIKDTDFESFLLSHLEKNT